MAINKNQHFVPRCYLRPFTIDSANLAINLFNVDRQKFIECASVKHQCSANYFYGENPALEHALQATEGAYAAALREITSTGYQLKNSHRELLRHFWLLQHIRTEAASRRAVEMTAEMGSVIGVGSHEFGLGIREAVLIALHTFVECMDIADDLKICLLRNRTSVPFFTSDDPAVLTNRWHLEDKRSKWRAFGLRAAGNLLLLPLSPDVFCLGYDGDVYSIPHEHGWVDLRHEMDIHALNQHQILNCRANIFVRDSIHAKLVRDEWNKFAPLRPETKHRIHYAIRDRDEGDFTRYQVTDTSIENDHEGAIIHSEAVHARPCAWPQILRWRQNGFVFTNDTGAGYVRRARIEPGLRKFHKESARQKKRNLAPRAY